MFEFNERTARKVEELIDINRLQRVIPNCSPECIAKIVEKIYVASTDAEYVEAAFAIRSLGCRCGFLKKTVESSTSALKNLVDCFHYAIVYIAYCKYGRMNPIRKAA